MGLIATYNPDLGRIELAGTSLGAGATYAVFDRTLNSVTYTTVRGGSDGTTTAGSAAVDDYEFPVGVLVTYRVRSYNASDVLQTTFTTTITQNVDEVWVKVPARPFLNMPVTVTGVGEVTRPARNGVFQVSGRSFPVAVSDARQSRQFPIEVMTETPTEAEAFDFLLMSGEPIYLQVPTGFPVPSVYAVIGDVTITEPARGDPTRLFTLPLVEVAQPGPDIIGTTYTIQSMLNEYATISAVMAGNATIHDLLERVGSPSEVLVP
jgi:hypothetical protein